MHVSTLWSNQGLFFSLNGQMAPKGIRTRLTIPSQMTVWEAAAVVEFAGRIGYHLPDLPLPVYENMFQTDQLDQNGHMLLSSSEKFHLVMGHDWDWLAKVIGKPIRELESVRQEGRQESGILLLVRQESRTILVVTGTSPQMTLHAARALVTERTGADALEAAVPLLIPPVMSFHPSGSAEQPAENRQLFSLHNLFTTEGIFRKRDGELPSTLDVSLSVGTPRHEETIALVELAARMAQAAGSVCFPMTHTAGEEGRRDRFAIEIDTAVQSESELSLALLDDRHALRLISHSSRLVPFVRELIAEGLEPLDDWERDTWRHRFAALKSGCMDIALRAQLGMQAFTRNRSGQLRELQLPEHLAQPVELWQNYVAVNGEDDPVSIVTEPAEPIYTAKWDDPGELEEMEKYVSDAVGTLLGTLLPGTELDIEVTTTSSERTFREWSERVQSHIREKWGVSARLVFRDANKSGLNWAMQEVLPQIKTMADVQRVELRARAFRPSDKHLDLVHRFLQELYPFDAILGAELGLPIEQIALRLDEDAEAPMFSAAAFGHDGVELKAWSWEGWAESLLYMPDQSKRGYVMVPFAGVRLHEAATGRELASQSFPTNPYRFWKWYQQVVLPEVLERVGKNQGVPKFSRLECHVGMDAVEKKVPHLEENSSVMEALHEDIYFYTLHAMHDHGKKVGDPEWDAPGGILPFMHVEQGGRPWASVALYAFPNDHRIQVANSQQQTETLTPIPAALFEGARITALSRADKQRSFSIEGLAERQLQESCADWLASSSQKAIVASMDKRGSGQRGEKSIGEDLFVNEDVHNWLESNRKAILGQVTPIDFSLNGRWLWMVELFGQKIGAGMSSRPEKHGLYKPTFFINARHHANEVSSTNAALQFIDQLNREPQLLESVNLVIVPLENADGAALHATMAEENPCWKLHAARYNACGLEFAKYRFQDDVPFGESRVYPKVWGRWAPDIVLDDHGIPSHEWIQPFSGYNSPPRFPVSYWIPSARMYTIWRELTEASPRQKEAYESLRTFLTKRLDADQAVAADNKDWLRTYERWGNDFDPVHFPIELSNGSIAYTRLSPINRASHDLIERFPEWVTADLMTEVNDETVYGKELSACRHAHHVVHRAIADWMKDRPIQLRQIKQLMPNGTIRIGLERSRPL